MKTQTTCDGCGVKDHTTGAIIDGVYGQYCRGCRSKSNRLDSPLSAQYHRDRDREDNARDLIQPRNAMGQPNREFIREYREEAEKIFTKEELENV